MRLIDADALMETIQDNEYELLTKHNSKGNGMFTLGIQQAVDEAPTIEPVKWISVSERLPEKSGNYLCWNMSSKVRDIETWEMEIFYWEENLWLANAWCFATRHPAYWMPLPQPPQKGE